MKKIIGVIVALIVVFYIIGTVVGNDEETNKEDEPTKEVVAEETEDQVEEDSEEEEATEDEPVAEQEDEGVTDKEIEVNEEIELGNITIKLENVYIKDNELSFGFWWNHWASNDEVHFSYFAYPVVTQNGVELEQQDEKDSLLRQTQKGVDSRVDLKYELEDDSPVEIKFKTTSDDPEEEIINIDVK